MEMTAEMGSVDLSAQGKTQLPLEMTEIEGDEGSIYVGGVKTSRQSATLAGSKMVDKEKKIGHRRVDDTGQVTYKKKPTSELMAAMQLGIGQSVGALASKRDRDLLLQDFAIVESVFYPREGSNLTPAHHYSDFRFKTYAPIAFRYFRELFNIQPDDFLLSMCNEPMLELSNPGASGSIFYISADDEFIIKTVLHKEADFLQKLLPGYYMNLNQNPRTLLPKFYGLYCYQCGGKNIRFTVMNNLLPSSIKMHEKYDLKGSTYKRKASKQERTKRSPTFKDLDFMELHPEGVMLEADTYNALMKTIDRDCRVLQSFKIMDYSLLLGVYNLDQAAKGKVSEHENRHGSIGSLGDDGQASSPEDNNRGNNGVSRGKSMRQRVAQYSTAMEAIHARSDPLDLNDDDIPPGGIPARNNKGERLLLYIGLIDILQSYRFKKRLEHAMKAMVIDGDTISVHRPGFYSNRFQSFLRDKVFKKIVSSLKQSPSKKKGIVTKTRTMTDVEGRIADKYMTETHLRSRTLPSDHELGGGRPDIVPAHATPPRLSLVDSHHHRFLEDSPRSMAYTQQYNRPSVVTTSPSFPSEPDNLPPSVGSGGGISLERHLPSPVHSFTESTPTHTEQTEGTPSFTMSSASVNSDMLGGKNSTPVFSTRSVGSRLSDQIVSSEVMELELSHPAHGSSVDVPIATPSDIRLHSPGPGASQTAVDARISSQDDGEPETVMTAL